MIAITAVLYLAGTAAAGALSRLSPTAQWGLYAHTLIPIAVGYAVAHYTSCCCSTGS
jgi:hypothetical protein